MLDLDYSKKSDRKKFQTIVKVADPEGEKLLLKHRVVEFFKMGGFLHLDTLSEEQKRLSEEDKSDLDDDIVEVLTAEDDDEDYQIFDKGDKFKSAYFGNGQTDEPFEFRES